MNILTVLHEFEKIQLLAIKRAEELVVAKNDVDFNLKCNTLRFEKIDPDSSEIEVVFHTDGGECFSATLNIKMLEATDEQWNDNIEVTTMLKNKRVVEQKQKEAIQAEEKERAELTRLFNKYEQVSTCA